MLQSQPVQTTFNRYLTPAHAGMVATTSGWDADTGIAEAASPNGIGFGLAVSYSGITDRGCVLGQLSGREFWGITMSDPTLANISVNPGFTDLYQEGENVGVFVRGDIWVLPLGNVTFGDAVYFDSVTGQLGDSGIANGVALQNARWMTSIPDKDVHVPNLFAIVRLGASAQ
jgi:hypothetical protein